MPHFMLRSAVRARLTDHQCRQGFAWGVFDKDGQKDGLGTLNNLSAEAVLAAKSEIQSGKTIALNWGLEKLHQPGFGRCSLQHKLVDWKQKAIELGTPPFFSYDDEISVNTQAGSQWDGIRHWGHQESGTYYNGVKHADVPGAEQLGIDREFILSCSIFGVKKPTRSTS